MPKIPLYNRGQGPATPLATGSLGPKLSSQVFEAAAAAQSGAISKSLAAASEVAAEFEIRAQQAELEAAERDLMNRADDDAFRYVSENKDDNYRAYEINSSEFSSKWIAENVDTYSGLNKRQKQALSNVIDKRFALKLGPGKINAFNRQQAKNTKIFNDSGNILAKDMANLMSQSDAGPDMARRNMAMMQTLDAEIEGLYQSAVDQGLQISWTPETVRFAAEEERVINLSLDPTVTAESMRKEADLIRGGDGRYSDYSAAQRTQLGQRLTASINKLESEETALASSNIQGSISAMKLATTDEQRAFHYEQGLANVATLRRAGQNATAETREFELNAMLNATQTLSEIKYGNNLDVQAYVKGLRDTAMSLVADATADPKAIRQAEANLAAAKALVADRKAKIIEDPSGYVASIFQSENDRMPSSQEMVDLQRQIGVPEYNIVPFTSVQFDALTKDLKEMNSQDQLDALARFFKPMDDAGMGDMAMRHAMRHGLSPVQMMAARSYDLGPRERIRVADLLDAEKLFQEDKAIFDALVDKDTQKTIRENVTDELKPFMESVLGADASAQRTTGERIGSLVGIQNAVTKLATYYASQGDSEKTAARKAAEVVVSRYEIQEAEAGVFESQNLRIPARLLERGEAQSNYMRAILKKYVQTPGYLGSIVSRVKKADGTPFSDVEQEKYIDDLLLYGKWVNTDDDSGLYLVHRNDSPVLRGVNELGEQGEFRVQINMQDLADVALRLLEMEEEEGIDYVGSMSIDAILGMM